jgi:hypothetical protein
MCHSGAMLTANGGFLLTIPLVLGIIAESGSARRGRWLMWVGAAYLTLTLLQMEILILPEFVAQLRSYRRLGGLGPIVFPLSIVSVFLIVWCDLALLIDAAKTRRSSTASERLSAGAGDWIVWVTALVFSVYSFWGIPFLFRAFNQGFDRFDILATALASILIAIVFDIGLLIDAAKMWRARSTGATSSAPNSS